MRDYGWPALAAFTLFNIGGAMAMGFYFKSAQQQQNFERKHKSAIAGFSYVTIAYQLFFIGWLSIVIEQLALLPLTLSLALGIYFTKRYINFGALVFYGISIALFAHFLSQDFVPIDISAKGYWVHALLPLAIGFIFSPYLDITFHRAFKNSQNPKASFALAFGILFLTLLFFVFVYAANLSEVVFQHSLFSAILYPVILFLVLQTAFTMAAHCSELRSQKYLKSSTMFSGIGVFSLLVLGLLSIAKESLIPIVNLPLEETLYKSFLFFYSLVFPLYLLLGKSKLLFINTLAICTPAYSIGFLFGGEQSYMLSVGVAIMFSALILKHKRLI